MKLNESLVWGERAVKSFIDRTTMYRLVFYYLLLIFVATLCFSIFEILPYTATTLLWSVGVLTVSAWIVNTLFVRMFSVVTNQESVFITVLILAFVVPPTGVSDVTGSLVLAAVSALAVASKYLLVVQKKHLFNPAALALVLSTHLLSVPAAWWVAGNLVLLPFILIGGLILVYKLRKFDLLIAFGIAALITIWTISPDPLAGIQTTLQYSALFFFAFVMLTEPLTMPPTRSLRVVYGGLIGILFVWAPSLGPVSVSPEVALLIGNLFAFVVSPKGRYMLTFVERHPLANGIYEYLFHSDRPLRFSPGQYLEWTLSGVPVNNRGNRRFFTIASAPDEKMLALGVRFYEKPSAFKQTLANLHPGAIVSAASLAGDFTMPQDTKRKLAFLAGGIGVTPFASMARHCIAIEEPRDAILLYSSKTASEIAYQDLFARAAEKGWRTVYTLSEETFPGMRHGFIDAECIEKEIPDYRERIFYISGPPGMVNAMRDTLLALGVSRFNIKTDFFPGLA